MDQSDLASPGNHGSGDITPSSPSFVVMVVAVVASGPLFILVFGVGFFRSLAGIFVAFCLLCMVAAIASILRRHGLAKRRIVR